MMVLGTRFLYDAAREHASKRQHNKQSRYHPASSFGCELIAAPSACVRLARVRGAIPRLISSGVRPTRGASSGSRSGSGSSTLPAGRSTTTSASATTGLCQGSPRQSEQKRRRYQKCSCHDPFYPSQSLRRQPLTRSRDTGSFYETPIASGGSAFARISGQRPSALIASAIGSHITAPDPKAPDAPPVAAQAASGRNLYLSCQMSQPKWP